MADDNRWGVTFKDYSFNTLGDALRIISVIGASLLGLLETMRRWHKRRILMNNQVVTEIGVARDALKSTMGEYVSSFNDQLKRHTSDDMSALNSISTRLGDILGRFDELSDRMGEMSQRLGEMGSRINEIGNVVHDHAERLRIIEQDYRRGDRRGRTTE